MLNSAPPASTFLLKATRFFASSTPISKIATPVSGLAWIFPISLSKVASPSLLLVLDNFPTVNITSPGETGRPRLFVISNVTRPTSPVRRERLSALVVRFEIAAKQRATISSAFPLCNRSAAASLKKPAVSSGISLEATADVFAAAFRTEDVEGGPDNSNWKPWPRSRSIRTISLCCLTSNNKTEIPLLPARPVRPERCTYVSTSRGGSNCTTTSTSFMSMPRAATSVATKTLKAPARKAARMESRCFCPMSPCNACAVKLLNTPPETSSSARRFVSVNTIVFPKIFCCIVLLFAFFAAIAAAAISLIGWSLSSSSPAISSATSSATLFISLDISIAITSSSIDFLDSIPHGTWIAVWRTVVATRDPPPVSLVASITMTSSWYFLPICFTHGGVVAENIKHCGFFSLSSPKPSSIVSTSSANPIFSISSASSNTIKSAWFNRKVPRFKWSIIRPGVPTSISNPLRKALVCPSYETPPWKTSANKPKGRATVANSSFTWRANSLVGHNTIIDTPRPFCIRSVWGSLTPLSSKNFTSRVMEGNPNANVFPVPVRDRPITSRPAATGSKASPWTGVKCVIPLPLTTSITRWSNPAFNQRGLLVTRKFGSEKSVGVS